MEKLNYDALTKELFLYANAIARMPLVEWRDAVRRDEDIAPFQDPTFFIKYMNSKKPGVLKEVLDAAIHLQAVILKVQPLLLEELHKELEAGVNAANR